MKLLGPLSVETCLVVNRRGAWCNLKTIVILQSLCHAPTTLIVRKKREDCSLTLIFFLSNLVRDRFPSLYVSISSKLALKCSFVRVECSWHLMRGKGITLLRFIATFCGIDSIPQNIPHLQIECGEYPGISMKYCESHKTLFWIWIMWWEGRTRWLLL